MNAGEGASRFKPVIGDDCATRAGKKPAATRRADDSAVRQPHTGDVDRDIRISIRVTSAVLKHQAIHDDAVRACGEQLNDTGSGRGKDSGSGRGARERHIWRGDRDVRGDAEEGGEPDDLARIGGGEGRGEARLVRDDNVGGDGTGSSTADGE